MQWIIQLAAALLGVLLALLLSIGNEAFAQRDLSDVEIRVEHVRGNIHVLFGAGGNIGALTTADGVVLIDDQFAPLTDRILKAVEALDSGPVKFVVNTHWHGDHTGGNENLGKGGVIIIAHDNVYKRLADKEGRSGVLYDGLPDLTFNDQLTMHLGETVRAHYVAHAHTDGDSFIYFAETNVLHMGDLLFVDRYPFIDLDSGGSLEGMIAGLERAHALSDEQTAIIGGHGPLTDRQGLERALNMLKLARERVSTLKADGQTLDKIIAAHPMAEYDEEWGQGFIGPDAFITAVYRSLAAEH